MSSDDEAHYTRNESSGARIDRNWSDLLQELRVMQTGVQLLTGFLLTIPFQARFSELSDPQVVLFLSLVVLASVTTILLLSVVMLHRTLFGRQVKDRLVANADRLVRATVLLIGLLLLGVCVLIFDVVIGGGVTWVVAGMLLALVIGAWFVWPGAVRRRALRGSRDD